MYLAIGLFVYFRRGNAPRALHFFLLCLARFILSTFHYSGKLNNFDKVIYLGNVVAGIPGADAVSAFLLACFRSRRSGSAGGGAAAALVVPARALALLAIHLGVVFGWLRTAAPLLEMRWLLDRVWLAFLCAMYLGGRSGAGARSCAAPTIPSSAAS